MLNCLAPTSLNWSDTSIYNVDGNTQYFIAPEPDITSRIAGARWEFLCKESEAAFDRLARENPADAQKAISDFKLKWPRSTEGDPDIAGDTPIWVTTSGKYHINRDCRYRGNGPPTTYAKRGESKLCYYCRCRFVVQSV